MMKPIAGQLPIFFLKKNLSSKVNYFIYIIFYFKSRSEASSGGSKIIGDITIAEYEGSPRRYRPRTSPPAQIRESNVAAVATATASNKQQSTKQRPPLRLPGFPQRVLPPTENNDEVKVAAAAELSRG